MYQCVKSCPINMLKVIHLNPVLDPCLFAIQENDANVNLD